MRDWLTGRNQIWNLQLKLHKTEAQVVLVTTDRERHRRQLLERSGSEFFTTFGSKYGDSEDEIIQYYQKEREMFLDIAARTPLQVHVLDTNDSDYVKKAYRFWRG